MHKQNCFITLTYRDEQLPPGASLRHGDFQKFIKRLRQTIFRNERKSKPEPTKGTPLCPSGTTEKRFNKKLKYYMCGEYGARTKRPHYHACIFGYDFPDKKYWRKTANNQTLYTSELLTEIWGHGHTTIGEVNFETAAYTARYIMKKITGQEQKKHYETLDMETGEIISRLPEYNKMSLRPAIGREWLERYAADAYPQGRVVVRNHQSKTPKYYDKIYKKTNPLEYEDLLFERDKEGRKRAADNTPQRLQAKETVARAKLGLLKRTLD